MARSVIELVSSAILLLVAYHLSYQFDWCLIKSLFRSPGGGHQEKLFGACLPESWPAVLSQGSGFDGVLRMDENP